MSTRSCSDSAVVRGMAIVFGYADPRGVCIGRRCPPNSPTEQYMMKQGSQIALVAWAGVPKDTHDLYEL